MSETPALSRGRKIRNPVILHYILSLGLTWATQHPVLERKKRQEGKEKERGRI